MKAFSYLNPTRAVFGEDALDRLGELVRYAEKILVVHGESSAEKNGLLAQVFGRLEAAGKPFAIFGGVRANPLYEKAREGVALAKRERVDFILAVGGGSVIDTAKAIALGAVYDGELWDFYCAAAEPSSCLPVGAVLTVPGSGSEMSDCSVLTRGEQKWFCDTDLQRPVFAVLDLDSVLTVSRFQLLCGAFDTFMHAFERYMSAESSPLIEGLAESVMRGVLSAVDRALADPADREAKAELLVAGGLAQNGLLALGSSGGDWAVHALANEISGTYDTPHGAALAAIWAHWARYVRPRMSEKWGMFARNVMGVPGQDETAGDAGIEALAEKLRSWGLPVSLAELGMSPDEETICSLARRATRGDNEPVGKLSRLTKEEVKTIYRISLRRKG
ncbi:MAG: iron-containing alcohol dehydrogenase [Oscillospiraceae bacterium]|nr:iron-containing alcohol dehydrogenase [Oscillospiraceae bacterium]